MCVIDGWKSLLDGLEFETDTFWPWKSLLDGWKSLLDGLEFETSTN